MNGPHLKPIFFKKSNMHNKYSDFIISISFILLFLLIAIISINIFTIEESKIASTNGIVTNIWIHSSKLERLQENKIKYLFVDIGDISPKGEIITPKEEINLFLESIKKYEKFNNYNFILLPYTEIILDKYSLNEEFQDNLMQEHKNLINLGFNGAFIDIEKIPFNKRQDYLNFIEELNKNIPQNSTLAIYSGHLNDKNTNEWEWNLNLYQSIASEADIIIFPAYDTSIQDKKSYQNQIAEEIKELNKINSKAKFMLGIPTHKQYLETIENALEIYQQEANQNSNFIGISIFAEWTTDKEEWNIYRESFN